MKTNTRTITTAIAAIGMIALMSHTAQAQTNPTLPRIESLQITPQTDRLWTATVRLERVVTGNSVRVSLTSSNPTQARPVNSSLLVGRNNQSTQFRINVVPMVVPPAPHPAITRSITFVATANGTSKSITVNAVIPAASVPTPTTTRLRPLQANDMWQYRLTATATSQGQTIQLSGTDTTDVTSVVLSNQPVFRMRTSTVATALGQTMRSQSSEYYTQDAQNNRFRVASDVFSYMDYVAQIAFQIPGDWYVGLTRNGTERYRSGMTLTYTLNVVSYETVTVPAGTFQAYKTLVTQTCSNGSRLNGTIWVVPGLGNYIKEEATQVQGAISATFRRELSATNVQ